MSLLSDESENLAPGSYSSQRLQHASADHIHLTSRRCFVGPIPEGWLKSHRKSWYKRYLTLSDYSSRAATFSARSDISQHRQVTGLDGPSASATHGKSFRQPADIDEEPEDDDTVSDNEYSQGDKADGAENEDINELEAQSTVVEDMSGSPEEGSSRVQQLEVKSKPRPTFKERLKHKDVKDKKATTSFITAPTKPRKSIKSNFGSTSSVQSPPPSSFVTAKEKRVESGGSSKPTNQDTDKMSPHLQARTIDSPATLDSSTQPRWSTNDGTRQIINTDSTTNLLPQNQTDVEGEFALSRPSETSVPKPTASQETPATAHGVVRFNISETPDRSVDLRAAKLEEAGRHKTWRRLRQGSTHPGEIVKMEKMLLRVDSTIRELPPDYNENDSLKTESRAVEKWREFIVVCRETNTENAVFSIQMYKTRVIQSREISNVRSSSTHEIPLDHKTVHVNLFSSLDKTLVIWVPWKVGTRMYILRTRSMASAVEWYTFIRHCLGIQPTASLQVNVPDLDVTLQLANPFGELEASMDAAQAAGSEVTTMNATMTAEKAVANSIIQRCLNMLENNPEWTDVIASWTAKEKMGLAWKRYDRLEWVHGTNEQRMYGTLGMERTHELELRPKDHYPTNVNAGGESMDEPAPIEGFLIRLTSQKGHVRRLGKMYFKRLYFTTHNHLLCYCRPAKALPPPPPRSSLSKSTRIPSASEIIGQTPLIYAINPFPTRDGEIEWLHQGTTVSKERCDADAHKEAERKINSLLQVDGYIDLSHVIHVQDAQRGNSPADANVDRGPDVNFHDEVRDTRTDDGKTSQFDDKRTFELVMKNKLIIRLQAYNEVSKREWIARLRKLVQYWKLRLSDDMDMLKTVRSMNLKRLEIDEEFEARIGQFGSKWEVTRSVTSPKLFNMCGISCCRAITMSGNLYRKRKRHSTFQRCGVLLCHGQLLVFHDTLRKSSGKEIAHIQHERQAAIDLRNCYIYSGLVTEGDLLYQNQTFDNNHPGHHALPRVYLQDGWTSIDEDTMTCFVIWQSQNKSIFRASEERDAGGTRRRMRYVSRLGVPGRSIVFKTRSRAERDHWVMSIGMEIDRLQGVEDIRVVGPKTS